MKDDREMIGGIKDYLEGSGIDILRAKAVRMRRRCLRVRDTRRRKMSQNEHIDFMVYDYPLSII